MQKQKKAPYFAKAEKCKVDYEKNMKNYNKYLEEGRKEDEAVQLYSQRLVMTTMLRMVVKRSEPGYPMDDSWKSMSSSFDNIIALLGEMMETAKSIQETLKQERMKKQAELETTTLKENLVLLVISEPEESNLIESETLQQDQSLVVLQSNNILVLESGLSLNFKKTIAPTMMKSSFLLEARNGESEKWLLPHGCLDTISWSLRTSSEWKRGIMICDYGSAGSKSQFQPAQLRKYKSSIPPATALPPKANEVSCEQDDAPGESRSQQDDALYWCIVEAILPGEVKPQDAVEDILKNGSLFKESSLRLESTLLVVLTLHGVQLSDASVSIRFTDGTTFEELTDSEGYGISLWLVQGMFRANGGRGYIKKPDILLKSGSDSEIFEPKATLPVKTTLRVTIYMGEGWYLTSVPLSSILTS
ncbi:hypothetical protein Bca4012_084166 [Brassica carinata]